MIDTGARIVDYYHDSDRSTYVEAGHFRVRSEVIDAIARLFGESAVYDRQGFPTFTGRHEIADFFHNARSLEGAHCLSRIVLCVGIDLEKHVIPVHLACTPVKECITVSVCGTFAGHLYSTSGKNRRIDQERRVELAFTDYWVAFERVVLYRRSEIFEKDLTDTVSTVLN